MPTLSTAPGENSLFSRGRQRAFVKVQDGCRYRCTFCIVTIARGEERSRTVDEIIFEIKQLSQQGIHEAVLTGVHLGGYGSDLGTNLTDLISAILEKTEIARLRLGSLEPWDLPENFFALFQNPRLMPHLHLPLQSGSDSVLKRIARRCKTSEFAQIVTQARQQIPHFNVTTDIIVGFPGETADEWQDSLNFIQQVKFGHLHIFSYSPREGTAAASFTNPVPPVLQKQRSQELHQLAQILKQDFIATQLGQLLPILWEGQHELTESGNYLVFGYTPNYLRVVCEVANYATIENQIIEGRLMGLRGDVILVALGNL
jgi:threonylcarbamoyladenosine tRNA methylthiotransferase MtaB